MTKNKEKYIILLAIIVFYLLLVNESVIYVRANDDIDVDINLSLDKNGLVRLNKDKSDQSGKSWKVFIEKYKGFVVGIAGVGAVSMVLVFIFNFIKLGVVSDSPQERKEIVKGLMVSGIATALLGAVSLITYIFYYALN